MVDRIILFPYSLTLAFRNQLYSSGLLKQTSAEAPAVSVGNITVGGTGKTPHTEMILRTLLSHPKWGYRQIAVLSQGYRRQSRGFQQVPADGSALLYGDEPLQIAKKFPEVTVAVDKNRVEGCRFLCHPELLQTAKKARGCKHKDLPQADIIVLDDAFQYRKLKAAVNILLVDYNRPVHNDLLLPLGRLRDLPSRIHDADIIIVTKCPAYLNEWDKVKWAQQLGLKDYSTLSCTGHDSGQKKQTLLFTTVNYRPMAAVFPEGDARYIYSQRIVLFSGIAKDKPLRSYLNNSYQLVSHFNFPDHHRYTPRDIHAISRAAKAYPTAVIVTTEKDAQRVADVPDVPDFLKERMFYMPIDVSFLTEEEQAVFDTTLLSFLQEFRSERAQTLRESR